MHTITKSKQTLLAIVTLSLGALAFLITPIVTNAATFAYLDTGGEIQTVTADNWMIAINAAPNIATNSGVLILGGASEFIIDGGSLAHK